MKIGAFRTVIIFLIVCILSWIGGYWFGTNKVEFDWQNYRPSVQVEGKEPPPSVTNLDLTLFWTVLDKLKSSYYDQSVIDPQKLVNGAITGMVESLDDPYTVYLPPQENTDFKQGLAGKFEGIGAELGMNGKQIIVVAPLEGSPAQKAGVKAGDAIMKVNDEVTFGWTLAQAVEKIKGPKGSKVKLTLVHKGQDKVTDVSITRDEIQLKSVVMWVKKVKDVEGIDMSSTLKANAEDQVAYIRLSQFGDNTNQEWVGLVNELNLKAQTDKNIKGLILDLRNNPGGYLTDAVFISSDFLQEGDVVVMQEDGREQRMSLKTTRRGLLQQMPLIVLINKGSASASEIVSGAMRDHKRAKLLGETSFGKGTIQQAEDLGNGAGIHVTIAKWLTPNGTWVHKKGLTPDIEVKLDEKDPSRDTQLESAVEQLVR